jgi:hypothetical protein
MINCPLSTILESALAPAKHPIAEPPTAAFFRQHDALFDSARSKVLEPHIHAGDLPSDTMPAVLASASRSPVTPLQVTLWLCQPNQGALDLGLTWNRKECDPATTNVMATLITSENGTLIDSNPVGASPLSDRFMVSFNFPETLKAKYQTLDFQTIASLRPFRLILTVK